MGSKRNKIKKVLSPEPAPPVVDDDNLIDDLLAQMESNNSTVQTEAANVLQDVQNTAQPRPPKKDSRSRFQEREARKAAALASTYQQTDADADARLEAEIKHEETTIKRICDELGVEMYEINPDGHCLFSAVADQLMILGELLTASYVQTRTAAADYMLSHPDDFLPFLPSLDGEDGAGATDTGLMNLAQFTQYCSNVRTTAIWGGEPEILALSRAFNIPIHVVQTGNPPIVVHEPGVNTGKGGVGGKAVRISYHRRMYGLGEHYNSLRPKGLIKQIPGAIKAALS